MMFVLLIAGSGSGNEIISLIYGKHHKRMLYKAAQMLGSERGEEAVHDVFVKLIEQFDGNFEALRDKPAQFFVVTIRNHSLNLINKAAPITISEDEASYEVFADSTGNPEKLLLEKDAEDALVGLIQKLKPLPRMMLEYKYIQGYSNSEIAEILNVSQSAVSSRIDRAKKALKDKLMEGGMKI